MIVSIINPLAGGQSYTSLKSANDFVRRGRAIFENGQLRFVSRTERKQREYIKNLTFWNGADRNPLAMHRPGEVRS
jgi:hypothetical protein